MTFLFQSLICIGQQTRKDKKFLKVHWSDFHLSSLGGVLKSFPVKPVDTISMWWVLSVMIQTVQVGVMTVFVPPGSFKGHSAVYARTVIILIFCCKGVTTMPRKRITSSSWKHDMWIWFKPTELKYKQSYSAKGYKQLEILSVYFYLKKVTTREPKWRLLRLRLSSFSRDQ